MFQKLKQFKDMRDQAKHLQDMLGKESVTGEALGGKVVVTMDGNLTLTGVAIDEELLALDKKEKLQSALKDAHSEALKKNATRHGHENERNGWNAKYSWPQLMCTPNQLKT